MNTQTNEIKMLHEVIADYKLQNENLIEENEKITTENKELKAYKKFVKSKCENAIKPTPEKDTPTPEEEMNMVEKLSEELGQKELTIMKGELEISKVYGILREKIVKEEALTNYIENSLHTCLERDDEFQVEYAGSRDYRKYMKEIIDSMNENDYYTENGTYVITLQPAEDSYDRWLSIIRDEDSDDEEDIENLMRNR